MSKPSNIRFLNLPHWKRKVTKPPTFHDTVLRKTTPSFLPAPIIRFVDRLIAPAGKLWRGGQQGIKRLVQSACVVALLPVLSVMADPLFNGNLFGGEVMTFEQYQRFLQSATFWSITVMLCLVHAVFSFYFNGLAILVRDRQREQEITGKD
jgi:hypothetical protein